MKTTCKRLVAALLSICMLCSVLPMQSWAANAQTVQQGEQPASLVTPEGEIPADEDWNEAYPYGTFAFGTYQADVAEPGALTSEGAEIPQTALLPVYRVGGTTGRVTVRITYAPAVTTDESGKEYVYDYAASGKRDLLIEAENPNPLVAYQQIGLPEAERKMQPASAVSLQAVADGENRLVLSLIDAEQASGWRWQYRTPGGFWKNVEGADEATLELSWEDYSVLGITSWEDLDFRCVLTVEDALFCTLSLHGEQFTPWPEASAVPAEIEIPEEAGYTPVEFEDDYDMYAFDLSFADGETVKYIRVTALDDELAELPELGLFTIIGCEGGELSELCNTLTLMVSDNDAGEPSELGFTVSAVTVDRKTGVAEATVRRTGGTSYNVTVDYETVDGTAKAGVDYAAKRGTLAFAGSIDEITVPIQLISNEDTAEKCFSLMLSNVKGGGTAQLCKLSADTLTFTLAGESPKGETGQNLASVLSGHDGAEAASRVNTAQEALVPDGTTQQNRVSMEQPDPVTATMEIPDATRSFSIAPEFHFSRGDSYSDAYWHDWELICGGNVFGSDAANSVNYSSLWENRVCSGKDASSETLVDGTVGGTDKNGNTTFVKLANGNGGPLNCDYLSFNSNYRGEVRHVITGAGRLYDGVQLIANLEQVGRKKRSSNSYYIAPIVSLFGYTPDQTIFYETGSTNFYVKNESTMNHWLMTPDSDDWKLVYPVDNTEPNWPDQAFLGTLPLEWDQELFLFIEFVMAKQWDYSKLIDAYEKAQNDEKTVVNLPVYRVERRVLTKTDKIPIVIYTANDADEAGTWTPLPGNSDVYKKLAPTLALIPGAGGVNDNKQLYAGSAFTVDISGMLDSYSIPEGGLFLSKKDGTHVGTVERLGTNSNQWKITMDWDGMTEADCDAEYQINIVLERSQAIEVDLYPSIGDDQTAAFNRFMGKTATVACSALSGLNGKPPYFSTSQTHTLNGADFREKSDATAVYESKTRYKNIQSINFHQDPEDVILYNGRAYAGNATIPLTAEDMTHSVLRFEFHGKDYLDQISDMRVSIDHVELYYDKNGDGVIEGSYTNGTFLLAEDADGKPIDELITTRLKGDYPESTFKPAIGTDSDGKPVVYQYYLKVFYTLRPKAYHVPANASSSDRAQILPALASAVTDAAGAAALTPEQQSYRYLRGANTDGHPMYGAEATAMSYVDIPLGGDAGSVKYESVSKAVKDKNGKITGADTTETYTWTPNFVGNLLVPFVQPTPVIDTNNITGHPVPMAGKTIQYDQNSKSYNYDKPSEDAMNAFLGAMTGRSTFVLGVQKQTTPLEDIETRSLLQPETITMGTVSTTPNGDGVMNMASGGDAGGTDGSTPGDDAGYPEFGADLGTEMPSLELELGDYATLIIDGYQVGFAIGIPIYKYEDTNYSGAESNSTLYNGSTVHHTADATGETLTITSKDGNTVTTVRTEPDPKEPNRRTVVTRTETTDKNGNKTYKTVGVEQEYLGKKNGGWVDNGKRVENDLPPAPSQDDSSDNKFKEGFQEANGQMQTLADFISACKTRNMKKMKDFMSGAWKDEGLQNAKNGNCTSTKVEVSFTVQISIMFEYNPIDNCHFFKSAGLSASLGIELSAQHRFSFFPLAYVYVKLGIEVEVAVSLSVIRNPKLGSEITNFRQGSLEGLSQGSPVVFALDMSGKNPIRGFHIDLLGTVYMEIFDNPGLYNLPIDAGSLSGDGSEKEVLLEAYDKTVYIRLTPLRGQVVADRLRPVTGASSKVVFDGLSITPSIELEAGVGIGVELLKFELFVKTSIAITMTMGGYLEDTDKYEGFYISDFQWGLCVGFNVTALFFNYSMEAIGISVEGAQKGTGGYFSWEIKATALDGNKELWSKNTYTAADGKSLGTEEPEELITPNDNNFNLGPKDPGCRFNGLYDGASVPEPLNLNVGDDFPENCGWYLKENMTAYGWEGGAFKGETPMDKDVVKAAKDKVSMEIDVPAGTGKILVYFDGTLDYKVYHADDPETVLGQKEKVKKSPVEIAVGQTDAIVKLSPTKGTMIDRWAVEKPKTNDQILPTKAPQATSGSGLIHVSGPADVSASQRVTDANQADTRAITPTGTADFELSGYNTAGDAKKLVSGLANGYSCKLFQADGENYILYPLMLDGTAQLVLSKIVMTGDLSQVSGLAHPTDSTASEPWLKVDNDSFGDLDYNVSVDGKTVTVVWSAYPGSASGSAVERAKTVAVKRASLNLGTDAAFSAPTVLSENSESYRFLPAQAGQTAVWAESTGDAAQNNQRLAAYLIATNEGLTQEILDARTTDNALLASAVYRWVLQSDLNAIYGAGSVLTASTGAKAPIANELIENIEIGTLGGKTLALYSTSQAAYFDSAEPTPVTVTPDQFNAYTKLATIRRLYLRELEGDSWGEALLLETVIDFDGCTDDNLEARALQDGVYVGGSLAAAQADPYFGNLRFLTADLDGAGSNETLLLFEMGGNSYLLRQADVLALLSGGEGSILPIFEQTTGTDVSIGSDGENLAVVYTAAVPGSLSNAIYTAWWDRNLGGWGSPTILAMRHLQVYEDGIKYDMEPKELEQAYLGKQNTPAGNTGSMYRLSFSDLQMSTRTVTKADGTEGKQLLVLTNGSMQKLREQTLTMPGGDTINSVAPEGSAELSFYAIAFGVGDQALGQGQLSLAEYDFSAGKRLVGGLSFANTGTTAIRGSRDNPITVQLLVQSGTESQELATWKLIESIPSGGTVDLSFRALELNNTLPSGSSFWMEVSEDQAYFGADAFSATLPELLTVASKPDLSVTDFRAELRAVDQAAGTAELYLEATVLNTGNADAEDVYLQFAYDTGEKDDNGLAKYLPVNITGSQLTTTAQQLRGASDEAGYKNGIYPLKNGNDASLNRGCYRNVSGKLIVPINCFVSLEEFSGLHLRAEAYSGSDSPNYNRGLYSSDHNEYNDTNNRAELNLKHQTFFHVPTRISTALGTTLTLPVSFESTGANPELVLTEISDGTEGWEPRMGVCYYDPDRKIVVAAPNSTARQMLENGEVPTGILQIKDVATNSIVAITYKVGAMADGVNIYKDDASFTFHDANGDLTDLNAAAASNPGWMFLDKGVELGWTGGEAGEIPMNNDLSLCNQDGAYFTFETVADTLSFYFMGELTVKSNVFGSEQSFTSSPAVIDFGNDTGLRHSVTVTGKAGTRIDRYVAAYKTNTVPDADPNAPQILWNRSFPETASVLQGEGVPMTCYIVDGTGIKSVSFNNQTLSETSTPALVKLDEGLWCFDYSFTANGPYRVSATDLSDNSAKSSFGVDWFNDVLSVGAIAEAPGLTRSHLGFVDGSGNPVSTAGSLTAAPFLKSSYTPEANEQSAAYLFSEGVFSADPLGKTTEERWLANWNGYYQVRVDRADGSWARAITPLSNLDLTPPSVTLDLPGDGTPDAPYLIGSRADWQKMQAYVNGGNSSVGMCFLQTDDFAITDEDMTGTSGSRFRGVYDGGGHTLTFNSANAPKDCAPFRYAENASFRNLHVDGEVTTSNKFAAGILADAYGICSFYNCRVSLSVHSEINGDGTHGGLVSYTDPASTLSITGCTVDGSFLGENTTLCGGFVGYCRGVLTVRDSVFAPTAWAWTSSQNFYRWQGDYSRTLQNCYYLDVHANNQGSRGYAVTAGSNVALTRTGGTEYNVAGLYALPAGIFCNNALRAAEGETVSVLPYYAGSDPANAEDFFLASSGSFTESDKGYSLTMPAEDVVINVGTHEWAAPTYTWAEDNSAVTARRVCVHNAAHYETETVNVTSEITLQPSCTLPGETTYTASFTNQAFATQTKTLPNVPALQHDWGEPSYTWADDNSSVTATRVCARDANHEETETVNTASEVTKPATCTEPGETTYTATFTNPVFAQQTKTVPDVPALGHDWNEPTYTWAEDNSSVTATRVCARDASHEETETEETDSEVTKPATCTELGETTYTASFTNPAFEQQTKTVANVDPLGHDYQLTGWTWTGYTAAKANFVCSHDASHTLTLDAEITAVRTEPNCTEPGKVVYTATVTYNCWSYTDEKTEILPATGHDFVLTAWSWDGYSAASAIFTCQNDAGHVETIAATITSVRTDPKPEEDGSVVYTATVVFEGQSYTDSKTEILPAIGHDYELSGWSWEGYTKATASFIDRNGGDPISVEATIQVERTEPGCESTGQAVYTATVTLGEKSYSDSKTETLEALGHDWGEPSYEWAENHSSVTATAVCRRDATHVLTETVAAEYVLTKPSTYKEEGIGTYRAVFESEVFTEQTVQVVIPIISCDGGENCPSARFTDIPAHYWAHMYIDWAVVNQVTAGTGPTSFGPEMECSRSQFVTLLWRVMGSPEPTATDNPFTDVREKDYYYKAVLWAVENGITGGTSATTFGSRTPCSRAQIVTFLWRMEGSEEPTATENPFTDVKPGAYYEKAVLWAVEKGFTGGTSETTFSPKRVCTRVEAVTFLYREFAK